MNNRFCLMPDGYQFVIRDVEHGLNFLFLAEGGHGPTSDSIALAKRVVEFLNTLPPEETLTYPHATHHS